MCYVVLCERVGKIFRKSLAVGAQTSRFNQKLRPLAELVDIELARIRFLENPFRNSQVVYTETDGLMDVLIVKGLYRVWQ